MTSRIPPSRRDPDFATARTAKAVAGRTPGTGRVAAAAPVLPGGVAAMLRGKAGSGAGVKVTVSTTAPASPSIGDFWYDTDATC